MILSNENNVLKYFLNNEVTTSWNSVTVIFSYQLKQITVYDSSQSILK